MRLNLILLFVLMSLVASQSSCNKTYEAVAQIQQNPPFTLDSILNCQGQTSWDSTTIHNNLIGKWKWEFIKCYWNPEDANSVDFKNLIIEFNQNDSLEVKLNDQIAQRSSWHVTRLNDRYFKLSVNPIVPQLLGRVLYCNDRLLFYDSYIDGCDNYFQKQN